jgi:hypothetical protein
VIFAERLDRHGEVTERVRIERFPFRIGRAYTNDLVLDDPHVDPEHAVLDQAEDGTLVLRDTGSRNGLLRDGARETELPLAGQLVVEIGRTRLRLRDRDYAVAPALPLSRRGAPIEWLLSHWSSPLVVLALATALGLALLRQGTWRETGWSQWLTPTLFGIGGLTLWCGGWALATRFLRQRARFPAHMAVAGLLAIASELADEALQFARFLIESISLVQWADIAISGTLIGLLIYGHLRVAAVGSARVRGLAACVAAALVFGARALAQSESEPDWVSTLPYWSRLEPLPPVAWLPRESVDAFFEKSQVIEAELAELARKEASEGPLKGSQGEDEDDDAE